MEIKILDVSAGNVSGDIASYLLITDKYYIIIETGPSGAVKKLYRGLEEEGITARDIDIIVVTHIHLDHAGASGHIVKRNRDIKLYVHPRGYPHMIDPSKLWQSSKETLGELARIYGPPIPIARSNLVRADDGSKLDIGEDELVFIHTPGHASHHMTILLKGNGFLFSGDAAGLYHDNALVPITPKPHNPEKAIKSLEKLLEYDVKRVFFTHYGIYEPGKKAIKYAIRKWREWRDTLYEFYKKGYDVDRAYHELIEVDFEAGVMDKYFKSRGYAGDELKVSVEGMMSYFKWVEENPR